MLMLVCSAKFDVLGNYGYKKRIIVWNWDNNSPKT